VGLLRSNFKRNALGSEEEEEEEADEEDEEEAEEEEEEEGCDDWRAEDLRSDVCSSFRNSGSANAMLLAISSFFRSA
jgi:hypothetical protein